jgi:hypothetical protein
MSQAHHSRKNLEFTFVDVTWRAGKKARHYCADLAAAWLARQKLKMCFCPHALEWPVCLPL